ncbi:hypothetical protein LY78DRAFT_738419 [Colletotrichum sublineola]|uniref:Uncharacterized protein n=1 Tax=Colletotrichum sublineola TaxID=1173701 RepID=A0A066XWS6_COLSU|nr:hypothetical protein LY78DRAFT_738419 [Colletotrichum sublineola]KDN72149.1 hypothetical protein CSUB01_11441 [Colletotrichum sublineola]
MPSASQIFYALAVTAAASVQAAATDGPAYSAGPIIDGTFLQSATSTLILPALPVNNNGDASLSANIFTDGPNRVQSVARSAKGQWEIFARALQPSGTIQSSSSYASGGDQVTMNYQYDDNSKNYTQTISINGKAVITLSTSDGIARWWKTAVECAANDCGTVAAHSWTNTALILNNTDPNLDSTFSKSVNVTGDLTTTDEGKTWSAPAIDIPAFSFA